MKKEIYSQPDQQNQHFLDEIETARKSNQQQKLTPTLRMRTLQHWSLLRMSQSQMTSLRLILMGLPTMRYVCGKFFSCDLSFVDNIVLVG